MSGASGSVRLISPPWPVWRTEPCAGTWKVQPARKVDGMPGDGIRFFFSPTSAPFTLEKISVAEAASLTDLRFRVVR